MLHRPVTIEARTGDAKSAALVRQLATRFRRAGGHVGQAGESPRRMAAGVVEVECIPSDSADACAEQAYRLRIRPDLIQLRAASAAGLRYAVATLMQLLASGRSAIRAMDIDDRPDFAVRGVMLDISRCKVPTLGSLCRLITRLATWKINHLQLYMEHTFAYTAHERVWRGASPLTGLQIEELDRYCAEQGIELAPNQNSFGHMERWLRHRPYVELAEADGPYTTPWGEIRRTRTTLNPLHPGSLRLVAALYEELLPHFRSPLFNVGCDETWELGQGCSREVCRRRGLGRVYLDFLGKVHRLVRRHGRRMMFWADIAQQHPELLDDLPDDVIPLVWGYEADHPFDRQCERWAERRLPFFVCPGTSSWCSFGGRTRNCLANLRNAAAAGLRHGATGYLITDWGDFGHRQYLPASYLGFMGGAAMSWCGRANANLDVAAELSRHAFADATGLAGRLWFDAGRIHEFSGVVRPNRTVLFDCLRHPLHDPRGIEGLRANRVATMAEAAEGLLAGAGGLSCSDEEGRLVREELRATALILRHACRRAAHLLGETAGREASRQRRRLAGEVRDIMARHRVLWLARNRPGGLAESTSYYRRNLRDYGG